ncbi:MAG: HEAT repeat domain-containing protein [Candidatus Eisenbacteria bacterium]|uniref:HEAT repeat domain-containing protein n=1 Tax=Eiseniibacteriota bacterium TaxID=2212470 RepID=A0A938BKZ3_UNCEI|nr:HEAT repeat domain-containing protein [Candidatus Eisenbacteria bacterium]
MTTRTALYSEPGAEQGPVAVSEGAGKHLDEAARAVASAHPSAGPILQLLQTRVDRALECDTPDLLIGTLAAVAAQRPAMESAGLKTHAFRELRQGLGSASARRKAWTWTRICASRPEAEARELACALLDTFWRDHRKEVERIALNLARDEDREVRLYAASTIARIIRSSFRANVRYLRAWSRHADPSVRRQVIIATVAVADEEHPEWARLLLDMLEPHLSDRDPYIRRNLGPFALGQGMLRVYPQETLDRLEKWLQSDNEIVRWNVAMAFTAPIGALALERGLEILRLLAADPRRFVWGAAALAIKNLATLRPRRVRPVLRQWMKDPALRVAVSTALNASVR